MKKQARISVSTDGSVRADEFITPPKEVYAYMVTYNSQLMPANNWIYAPAWEEFYCSPDTGKGGENSILYPIKGGGSFAMYFEIDGQADPYGEPDKGIGCYVVEVTATFFDNGTPPVAGDWWAIGNLMQSGSTLGNFDRHIYQPAEMVNEHSRDHAFSNWAIRMFWTDFLPDRFFLAEIGNFCGTKQMWVDSVEMQVFRVGRKGGSDSDMVYITPGTQP